MPPGDIEDVLLKAAAIGLQATHYRRWEIGSNAFARVRQIVLTTELPAGLTFVSLTPQTPPDVVASFAEMSLACGGLPACLSAHKGELQKAGTLVAVTDHGHVASSAYASAYISDGSVRARRECFWGMLATAPAWRGQRLSMFLGARLLLEMHERFGFTEFYTGVFDGNAASEAVCGKLGLRTTGNSIVTFADTAQLPSGRMTK